MKWIVAALAVCALIPCTLSATASPDWCYHQDSCNDTTWPVTFSNYCNGSRQSPINIVTESAEPNDQLTAFTFTNFDNTSALNKIQNTGRTVKVTFNSGVSVSGGGLSEPYDSLQFHLHWGNGTSVPGSEHTVDGRQYPMELHIVNIKSSLNGNTTLGVADSTGLAALGFLIEAKSDDSTDEPASWKTLTSFLANITNSGEYVSITSAGLTLDDLLVGVDRTKYYRYLGSLTTPSCNEAVVWTVFKDTIKVSKNLINLFSTTVHFSNSSSPYMTNVFRDLQPSQPVTTQSTPSSGISQTAATCTTLGLMALSLALGRG